MKQYRLFGTSACHLCDIAESMVVSADGYGDRFTLEKVDIADSDELFERYGLVIPVLANPQGDELRWPFSASELEAFVG